MSLELFRSGTSVIDLSDRQLLRLTGEQATWFLDQLVTQKVDDLAIGTGAEALLLTPKGRIVSMMRIVRAEEAVWLDADPLSGLDLFTFFVGRIFATKVQIDSLAGTHACIGVRGQGSAEASASALGIDPTSLPRSEHDVVLVPGGVAIAATRPVSGYDLIVEGSADQVIDRLVTNGVVEANQRQSAEIRSYEGVPTYGVDIDETYLPQEASMERMVHFKKGCYLGQEAVAMTQRGRVKRKLRRIRFDADPGLGEVTVDGETVGMVSSFGVDGDAMGLATISTSVAPGAPVTVGPSLLPAKIEELPFSSEGPKVPSARELRESLEGGAPL